MGLSLSPSSKTIGSITVACVLVVGLTDWLQGSTPDGVVDVGDGAGLALFGLCSIGVAVGALVATERGVDEPVIGDLVIVMALATFASLLADPTYAVLLFAVPLVHIARRWPEPLRSRTIVAIFVLAGVLISLEDQPWGGNNLESAMMLSIALLITTMLGSALGRLDEARTSESASARLDERERLAGELHDSVGHSLLATSIQLRNARALWDADAAGAQRSVELASRAVDDALVDTRIAVDTIRSRSEPFSLTAALPELIDRMASPALTVELTLDGPVASVDQLAQITSGRSERANVHPNQASRTRAEDLPPLPAGFEGLSPRERDVLRLVATGMNNREIGQQLHLSAGTVKNHVSAILRRLGTTDRTEAAVLATKHRLI